MSVRAPTNINGPARPLIKKKCFTDNIRLDPCGQKQEQSHTDFKPGFIKGLPENVNLRPYVEQESRFSEDC
jgi:hypothetical protein